MKTNVLIGGIGNVLLGDDAVGPYIIRVLESEYIFTDDVEIADLGTPALDLTHRIAGMRAVILVDCVASREHSPGTVLLYGKEDILRVAPAQRLDPHSPALSECLMAAEMLGACPTKFLLVGIVGGCFDPGLPLSPAVRQATGRAIGAILAALERSGIAYQKQVNGGEPIIWWSDSPAAPQKSSNSEQS